MRLPAESFGLFIFLSPAPGLTSWCSELVVTVDGQMGVLIPRPSVWGYWRDGHEYDLVSAPWELRVQCGEQTREAQGQPRVRRLPAGKPTPSGNPGEARGLSDPARGGKGAGEVPGGQEP